MVSVMSRGASQCFVVSVVALVSAGCLSLDNVATRQADAGPADGGPRDAEAPDAGNQGEMTTCVERGEYEIDGIPVVGLKQACGSDLVCVDGRCSPEPECAPGVEAACFFPIPLKHGHLVQVVATGGYVFWLEGGTLEADGTTYRDDGALMRAKIGTWLPEEVLTHLDLFASRGTNKPGPFAWDNWISFSGGGDIITVSSLDGQQHYDLGPAQAHCVAPDGSVLSSLGGDKVSLSSPLAEGSTTREFADFATCVFGDGAFWALSSHSLRQLNLGGEAATYMYLDELVAIRGETVVGTYGHLIGTAPLDNGQSLVWTNRAGGTGKPFGQPVLRGDEVFWARQDSQPKRSVILRGDLSRTDKVEVVAEMGPTDGLSGEIAATDEGLLWHVSGSNEVHFVPLPAASN